MPPLEKHAAQGEQFVHGIPEWTRGEARGSEKRSKGTIQRLRANGLTAVRRYPENVQVEVFLKYLDLENTPAVKYKMGKSGKNVDSITPIYTVPRGGPHLLDRVRVITPAALSSSAKFLRKQKDSQIEYKLKKVFCAYCTSKSPAGDLLGLNGFRKILRETKLLDNKFEMNDADILFNRIIRDSVEEGSKVTSKMNFSQFQDLLTHVAEYKLPMEPPELSRAKVVADVIRYGVKPEDYGKDEVITDVLLSEPVIKIFKKYERKIKDIFAFYATLDLVSADVSSWKAVQQANRSMNVNEATILLLNFDLSPMLVSKREAIDIFRFVNMAPSGDESSDDMCYPQFLEFLGRLAVLVRDKVAEKLISPATSIVEMASIRQYIGFCDGAAKEHFNTILNNRAAEVRQQKEKLEGEARAKAQEQVRLEQEKEMEMYHKAQLVKARRAALSRMQTRWVENDNLTMKTKTPRPHGSTRGTMKPMTATSDRLANRTRQIDRGTTYLDQLSRASPGGRTAAKNVVSLGLESSTMSHFVDMDMESQGMLHEMKTRRKPPLRQPTMGVMADADMSRAEVEDFETRLSSLKGGGPVPNKMNLNANVSNKLWVSENGGSTVKLPGISDRRIGSPRSAAIGY